MLQLAEKYFKTEAINILKDIKVSGSESWEHGLDFHGVDLNREI